MDRAWLSPRYPSYTYQPLGDASSKQIRLIDLPPSSDASELPSIQIRTASLADEPNVHVVDSGAVPLISIANLQSTVYAVAERAADLTNYTYQL